MSRIAAIREFELPGAVELAQALARQAAQALNAGLAQRARASLVVPGGRTPAPFFEALSREALDWPRIDVTLADDRWLRADDPDSNEGLARKHLLRGAAAAAQLHGLVNAAPTPQAGEAAAERALAAVARPYDLVVLGMGEDGHVASLFPGAKQLPAALDMDSGRLCFGVDPPAAPHPRISLSLPALLDSRRLVLLFTGVAKQAVYRRAREGRADPALPVSFILHQTGTPVDVYWSR